MIYLSANRKTKVFRIFISTVLSFFISCSPVNQKLDYPNNIEGIIEVEFFRPNEKPVGGDWSKELSRDEIEELLEALMEAKYVGPTKFKPDFIIFIVTKSEGTYKLKVKGNKIKGYENDFTHEIENLKSITTFQRK